MDSNEDKKIQLRKAQLKIANEIKRICDNNNINYFLEGGTLIGTIRHKGFIPWDDDLDMSMLKEDYDKFLKIAQNELGDEFFIDNYENNEEYGLVFSKIKLKNTKYVEKIADKNSKHLEIFVDIFPYYGRPENKFIRKIQSFKLKVLSQIFMAKSGMKVWKNKKKFGNFKFIPIIIVSKIMSKPKIYKKINKIINAYPNSNIIGVHDGMSYSYWYFPKEYLNEFIESEFENYYFKIPKKYHEILTIGYGDYMKIPPEDQRENHNIIELDIGDNL